MESIEDLLKQIKAKERGVYFRKPLSLAKIKSLAARIHAEMGVEIPDEYIRLLRVTNGIQTQRGYLSDLEEIRSQNIEIWSMESEGGVSADGDFQIRSKPRAKPQEMTYLWLGYDGNSAEQILDLDSGEYRQMVLGGTDEPLNKDRSLIGLLRHLVYRES